jgi:hypothetical protein
VVWPQNH